MPDSPPPTPTPKKDDAQRSLYGEYSSTSTYIFDPGVEWMPSGEPRPTDPEKLKTFRPMVPIQVRHPVRWRRVYARGEKVGSPPLMPSPRSSGRFEFVGGRATVTQPVGTLDGVSAKWVVEAELDFIENCDPEYYGGGLVLGGTPYSTESNLAMDNFPSPSPTDSSLHERASSARRGEAMGRRIDHARPDLGLLYTNGAYSENYFPNAFFDDTLVNGAEAVLPQPPPPTIPPPPTP
ncbi:hypothetical protein [Limnoglobus roseus]|uniref:Uncharacterized protein n=1 Tax=Limnoglobus roseus TaxID=2598579 RepID=A0A5C1A562_9BACT|nr:hypothetical protein [Limnoglobus roseus]QEL14269.1 hypothetical protein PX52LOC_01139 [Limnoglobus roseus]